MRNNPYIDYLVDEMSAFIDNTIFYKDIDKVIARNVYVEAMSVEKCADEIGYEPKSVQNRLPLIRSRLDATIHRQYRQ